MVPSAVPNVCIDRYEWPNKKGVYPLTYASALEDDRTNVVLDANTLCAGHPEHKRPCDIEEWQSACFGTVPAACNVSALYLKVDEAKVDRWDMAELKRLDQSMPSGSLDRCRSVTGAYDMVGNVEEWVRCPQGMFGWCLMGRFWAEKTSSCNYVVRKHAPRWHYYETGFRCCKDMEEK